MIGSTRQVSVFAFGAPIDMRKGFDGLAAVVTLQLGRDPLSGDVFLFVNRTRKRAKVLLWDGTGLCIYAKRLEQGKSSRFPVRFILKDCGSTRRDSVGVYALSS